MELQVSEQLAYLCDVRLGAGPEGFEDALAEMSTGEIAAAFGEAVDALMDAETKHEREMRKLAERLQR